MINKLETKLLCKGVYYYSSHDEDAFFEWLKKISSITSMSFNLDELYLHFASDVIPDDDFREIIGLFYRYKIDMKQLQVFINNDNREWFCGKPKGYWYKRVFGK